MKNGKSVLCSVDGCTQKHCGRKGMCDRHYRKLVKYGDPTAGKFIWKALALDDKKSVKKYLLEKTDRMVIADWRNVHFGGLPVIHNRIHTVKQGNPQYL